VQRDEKWVDGFWKFGFVGLRDKGLFKRKRGWALGLPGLRHTLGEAYKGL